MGKVITLPDEIKNEPSEHPSPEIIITENVPEDIKQKLYQKAKEICDEEGFDEMMLAMCFLRQVKQYQEKQK